jgi:hypothetical protein
MRDKRGAYRVSVEYLRVRDHLEATGVNGMIILKRIFRNWDGSGAERT